MSLLAIWKQVSCYLIRRIRKFYSRLNKKTWWFQHSLSTWWYINIHVVSSISFVFLYFWNLLLELFFVCYYFNVGISIILLFIYLSLILFNFLNVTYIESYQVFEKLCTRNPESCCPNKSKKESSIVIRKTSAWVLSIELNLE